MKKTKLTSLFLLMSLSAWVAASGQDIPKQEKSGFPTPMGLSDEESSGHKSFDEFRKSIYSEYDRFRETILEHYADFLEGEWHEYEPMEGMKKYKEPKPKTVPTVDGVSTPESSLTDEQRKPRRKDRDMVTLLPDEDLAADLEVSMVTKNTDKLGLVGDSTLRKVMGAEKVRTLVKDVQHGFNPAETLPGDWLNFFQIDMRVPKIDFDIKDEIVQPSIDCAGQWRKLAADKVAERVIPELEKLAQKMNLNDYLKYELVAAYINGKFPDKSEFSRASAMHYLLTNMGYAVRLAYDKVNVIPYLMLPSDQQLWGRARVYINDHQYFFFAPTKGIEFKEPPVNWSFVSCGLPLEADYGHRFNFVIDNIQIPESPVEFNISYNGLTLKGEVNENLMPILQFYPQMDTGDYSTSVVQPELRKNLIEQIKEQLGDKDPVTAANSLLDFVQHGFQYMTDQDYHGYEKPYFVEESLYYPLNDCEDRSIFFTYFLWNALGIENQMIAYPGHEAAAIYLSESPSGTRSDGYTFRGKNFFISDPTYIGARIGECMPQYRNSLPENIDKYFSPN